MKRIVLISCGIINDKLKEEFLSLFEKNASELQVLYIPTAADVETGDMSWLEEEFNTIIDLGIREENILEYRMDYDLDITQFDFIYMMGGNTFYLLKKIRETGFDKKIVEALDQGVVYVGSSAGSIVMGITIETALPFDSNDDYVTDFTGMKLFPGIVIPHYSEMRKEYVIEQRKKYSVEIYTIANEHGIIIIDGKIREI